MIGTDCCINVLNVISWTFFIYVLSLSGHVWNHVILSLISTCTIRHVWKWLFALFYYFGHLSLNWLLSITWFLKKVWLLGCKKAHKSDKIKEKGWNLCLAMANAKATEWKKCARARSEWKSCVYINNNKELFWHAPKLHLCWCRNLFFWGCMSHISHIIFLRERERHGW
jgi:hypothetical protein